MEIFVAFIMFVILMLVLIYILLTTDPRDKDGNYPDWWV